MLSFCQFKYLSKHGECTWVECHQGFLISSLRFGTSEKGEAFCLRNRKLGRPLPLRSDAICCGPFRCSASALLFFVGQWMENCDATTENNPQILVVDIRFFSGNLNWLAVGFGDYWTPKMDQIWSILRSRNGPLNSQKNDAIFSLKNQFRWFCQCASPFPAFYLGLQITGCTCDRNACFWVVFFFTSPIKGFEMMVIQCI